MSIAISSRYQGPDNAYHDAGRSETAFASDVGVTPSGDLALMQSECRAGKPVYINVAWPRVQLEYNLQTHRWGIKSYRHIYSHGKWHASPTWHAMRADFEPPSNGMVEIDERRFGGTYIMARTARMQYTINDDDGMLYRTPTEEVVTRIDIDTISSAEIENMFSTAGYLYGQLAKAFIRAMRARHGKTWTCAVCGLFTREQHTAYPPPPLGQGGWLAAEQSAVPCESGAPGRGTAFNGRSKPVARTGHSPQHANDRRRTGAGAAARSLQLLRAPLRRCKLPPRALDSEGRGRLHAEEWRFEIVMGLVRAAAEVEEGAQEGEEADADSNDE